jgi:hypothetical protein
MRFSYRMVPEVYQLFWAAMARGEFITDAAVEAGTYRKQGTRWLVAAGGVRPRRGRGLKGRCLRLAQREEIALGRARGESVRSIPAAIGRSPSTVSRELRRNARSSMCGCVWRRPQPRRELRSAYSFGIIALAARRTPRFRLRAPTRVMAVGRDGEAGRRTTISSPTPMVPGLLTVA